jgi:hypothetical protein
VAYAVSQRGARRLLYEYGVRGWKGIFDGEMGMWCAGSIRERGEQWAEIDRDGEKERLCITTQPPIFAHHHPLRGESDIAGLGGGYARKFGTKYLRCSVRMGLGGLVWGRERACVDQWADDDDKE